MERFFEYLVGITIIVIMLRLVDHFSGVFPIIIN